MAAAVLLAAAVAVAMAAAASTQRAAAADAPLPLVAPAPVGLPNCTTTCGDVPVPYPFGLGPPRCSWPGFNLTCDAAASRPGAPPQLLLGDGTLEVVGVSLRNTTVPVVRRGDVANITSGRNVTFGRSFTGYSGFTLSDRNELVLSGCNVMAMLVGDLDEYSNIISGCASFCSSSDTSRGEIRQPAGKYCSGLGCCQAPVTMNYSRPEGVQVSWLRGGDDRQQDLLRLEPFVVVAEKGWFDQRPVADQLVGPPGGSQRPDAAAIEVESGFPTGTGPGRQVGSPPIGFKLPASGWRGATWSTTFAEAGPALEAMCQHQAEFYPSGHPLSDGQANLRGMSIGYPTPVT
ncbi:hypothetical protein C2845_PM01G34400 [Panicum miliaceum]|uniref:Wall-associated receptor kinase galacturonan-binding domain-containing protein n=1 Tax=Panicum miliaceum TaxID=4540 RepID=A0A3L6TKR6_PANMI|nr:hypothetical protein C2845_PM01G34400 [Panicum miliaceum]